MIYIKKLLVAFSTIKNQLSIGLWLFIPFVVCPFEHWKSDGLCDDVNNNKDCEYDGGDCCGGDNVNQYCVNCKCLSNIILIFYQFANSLSFLCFNVLSSVFIDSLYKSSSVESEPTFCWAKPSPAFW